MADNFRFDMTSEGSARLAKAFDLALSDHRRLRGYAIRPATPAVTGQQYEHLNVPAKPLRLVFFWAKPSTTPAAYTDAEEQFTAFPFEMDAAGAADFATRWLAEADYGREPDHDGDNGKGWRVWNEAWGHVDDQWEACLAVRPCWAMYGK